MTDRAKVAGILTPEAKHRDDLPGRHCAICGRVGGAGFRMVLRQLRRDGDHAHVDCIAKERKRFSKILAPRA